MGPILDLRRLTLFLALLPQLIGLGMGGGIVLCVAPAGKVEVEFASNTCCDGAGARSDESSSRRPAALSPSEDGHGCESCSDLEIALDPRASRGSGGTELRFQHLAAPPLPTSPPACAEPLRAGSPGGWFPGAGRPPHLMRLRGVTLRC